MRIPVALAAAAAAIVAATPSPAESLADVFDRVKDSVVVIKTVERNVDPEQGGKVALGGLGSGVLIDPSGLVLTAAHVVQAADSVEVEFRSGETIPAKIVASEPQTDVAVVKLERLPKDAVFAKGGDSDKVRIGDEIFVVGAPLGISHSLSVGHVGGRRVANTLFGGLSEAELFQTDASINKGNSGGPMFNLQGEVIGVVSSILSKSGGFEGIGFAVSSNTARRILSARPPWTGVEGILLQGTAAELLNLPQPVGLLVQRVAKGSPAEKMGLKAGEYRAELEGDTLLLGGDIILAVGGVRLSEDKARERILRILSGGAPGSHVTVTVLRAGRTLDLDYTVPPR